MFLYGEGIWMTTSALQHDIKIKGIDEENLQNASLRFPCAITNKFEIRSLYLHNKYQQFIYPE